MSGRKERTRNSPEKPSADAPPRLGIERELPRRKPDPVVGHRFGHVEIVAIFRAEEFHKQMRVQYLETKARLRCVRCGHVWVRRLAQVKNKPPRSCKRCADFHPHHEGRTRHPLYDTYNGWVQRCTNPKDRRYPQYGGRGIALHPPWRPTTNGRGFERAVAWIDRHLGPPPSDKHTIDRIDVNGDYEPWNLRWATAAEQRANRSDSAPGSLDELHQLEELARALAKILSVRTIRRIGLGGHVILLPLAVVSGALTRLGEMHGMPVDDRSRVEPPRPSFVSTDPLYRRWIRIRNVCLNKNSSQFRYYGGRGISMDAQWSALEGHAGFFRFRAYIYTHLGGPHPKETLDRIDNARGYVPGNLRWATPRLQGANRRNTKSHDAVALALLGDSLAQRLEGALDSAGRVRFHGHHATTKVGVVIDRLASEALLRKLRAGPTRRRVARSGRLKAPMRGA